MEAEAARAFRQFGPSHWAALGATAAATAALVWWVRAPGRKGRGAIAAAPPLGFDERRARIVGVALAALLLADEALAMGLAARAGPEALKRNLPLQLCDWVVIATAVALVGRRRLPYELAYFWGMAGTLQAVLTPDIAADFPDPGFLIFQVMHGGVIVSNLFLTFGLGFRPTLRSVPRAWLWANVYGAVAWIANLLLGTNYGYLRHKPDHASLLDWLGPWPYYLLSLEALSLPLFLLLYSPFALGERLRRRRARGRRPPQ
jgi:hypothetical integral membrane protein (TIGR02206 family)